MLGILRPYELTMMAHKVFGGVVCVDVLNTEKIQTEGKANKLPRGKFQLGGMPVKSLLYFSRLGVI